jgi:hypothetical protein
MPNVPVSRSSSHPISPKAPLLPAQLLRVTCEAGISDLLAGHAVIAISTGDESDSDTSVSWLQAFTDHAGHISSFRLTRFGTGEVCDLPADLSSCSCPDHVYRQERPGGCKHMRGLREALLGLGKASVVPDEDTIHADTRWTLTEMPWPGRESA